MQVGGNYDQDCQRRQLVSRVWRVDRSIERRLALIWINPVSGQQWEDAEGLLAVPAWPCRRNRKPPVLWRAVAWPLAARGQQPAMSVIGFLHGASAEPLAKRVAALREGE